jgi:hypothetical protein
MIITSVPDWANFGLLDDCLLCFFIITEEAKHFGYFLHGKIKFWQNMGWAPFWALFS